MDMGEIKSTMMTEGGGVIGASGGEIDNGEWRYGAINVKEYF